MTYIHRDRITKDNKDKGYSIRVGHRVPENSANLAYVHTPEITPENNLSIADESVNIPENQKEDAASVEKEMFPDTDFKLRELSGSSKIESSQVLITDEFSTATSQQDTPVPLYYKGTAEGLFNAVGAIVTPYSGGYSATPPEYRRDYASIPENEKENLLYLGGKIKVTHSDGTALGENEKYKVHLVATEGVGIPDNAYRIEVYTNFRNQNDNTYVLRYERYEKDGSHILDHTEVLNVNKFFHETEEPLLDELAKTPKANGTWKEALKAKEYALIKNDDETYEVKAPAQVITADQVTRPAHQFQYRLKAHLSAKLSERNPGMLNVGIAYLNKTVINVENLTGMMKRLFEDPLRPGYLDFQNPYPPQKSFLKDNTQYWTIDMDMSESEWLEYDLVILTGYGYQDMSRFGDNIRTYLEHGGTLWIDNAGRGKDVLSFSSSQKETFISTVGFSSTSERSGFKTGFQHTQPSLSRLYKLDKDVLSIGYESGTNKVNPAIVFGSGESAASWKTIIRYSDNLPSVIERTMYQKGKMIVSNCGVFRGLPLQGHTDNTRLFMNIALDIAERKWIHGPWQKSSVFHRNNLFREEYTDPNGKRSYVDAQNDYDPSQIVAKKLISDTTRHGILPYLPKSHYNAQGTYEVEVDSDTQIQIENPSFENGRYDSTELKPMVEWDVNTLKAIPGWDVKHVAGSKPVFKHIDDASSRGHKTVSIEAKSTTGSHAYWSQQTRELVGGRYRAKAWVKLEGVSGISTGGVKVSVHSLGGKVIADSIPLTGTRDWVEVPIDFNLQSAESVEIRIGFTDGNGKGVVYADHVSLNGIGSVYMTPTNDGKAPLTAWAVNPKGETFDLRAQGFTNADITVYDPVVKANILIRSFVYTWDNDTARYMKKYGNMVVERRKIRRSDGLVDFGPLSTLLPALNGGSDWADRNDVYYEVTVGDPAIVDTDSEFVNLQIYDNSTGRHYYSKHNGVVVRFMDLFYFGENRNIRLQARTDHYTIRATKRRYGVKVNPESGIYPMLPSTLDNREGWYLRIKNGAFKKDDLNYSDLKVLAKDQSRYKEMQNRVFGTHHYQLPEYRRQLFSGGIGLQDKHEEIAEYINDRTIRVQNTPLRVESGTVSKELMRKADGSGMVYQGLHRKWRKEVQVRVFVDEDMNGFETEWLHGFDVDYENGAILFEAPVLGTVKASYAYDNLHVWKRTYAHEKVRNEVLESTDRRTFSSKNRNWLRFPTPIVRAEAYYEDKVNNSLADTRRTLQENLDTAMDELAIAELGSTNIFSEKNYGTHSNSGAPMDNCTSAVIDVSPDTTYTIHRRNNDSNRFYVMVGRLDNGISEIMTINSTAGTLDDAFGKEISYTVTTGPEDTHIVVYLSNEGAMTNIQIQAEIGEKQTSWMPNPDDIQDRVIQLSVEISTTEERIRTEKESGAANDKTIMPVDAYTIDYSAGVVIFKEDVIDRVLVEYSYSKDEDLEVSDFDSENGFIHFKKDIDFREEIYVDYTYQENYLEYRGYYDEALGQFLHLDLNPSEGHFVTLPETRKSGNRTLTSWELKPSKALMNKEVYLYITPYKDSFNSYNEDTIRHCFSKKDWKAIQKANPAALLLGIVQVREHASVHDAVVMDARIKGGGLRADIGRQEVERKQPESRSYWDMESWDGTAYSKNGVLVIRVPERVLQSKGGRFTESMVEESVKKHIAYGLYPIIEYV